MYSKDFKAFNRPWNENSFNSHWKIGKVMAELTAMPAETTRKEWAEHYLAEVRTPEQVVQQVEDIVEKTGLDFVTALNWWWILVLDCTYEGVQNEHIMIRMVAEEVAKLGYEVRHSTDEEDRTMGVDFVVTDPSTGRIILGGQVKKIGYFLGWSAKHAREVVNPRKYKKWTELTGSPVWYVVVEPSLKKGRPEWRKPEFTVKEENQ
jgi:hypothetical protein